MACHTIKIVSKPDWISWDVIRNVIYESHAPNRAKGISMRKPSLPAEEIKKEVEGNGEMLVAMDCDSVVGTAALIKKDISAWYVKGHCGYLCYVAILPSYSRQGIYRELCEMVEKLAKENSYNGIYFDTHHKNQRILQISEKNGYKRVGVRNCGAHWNIVM